MFPSFQYTGRNVNLRTDRPKTRKEIIEQARRERKRKKELKLRHESSTKIQKSFRRFSVIHQQKQYQRKAFDLLLKLGTLNTSILSQLSKKCVFFYTPKYPDKTIHERDTKRFITLVKLMLYNLHKGEDTKIYLKKINSQRTPIEHANTRIIRSLLYFSLEFLEAKLVDEYQKKDKTLTDVENKRMTRDFGLILKFVEILSNVKNYFDEKTFITLFTRKFVTYVVEMISNLTRIVYQRNRRATRKSNSDDDSDDHLYARQEVKKLDKKQEIPATLLYLLSLCLRYVSDADKNIIFRKVISELFIYDFSNSENIITNDVLQYCSSSVINGVLEVLIADEEYFENTIDHKVKSVVYKNVLMYWMKLNKLIRECDLGIFLKFMKLFFLVNKRKQENKEIWKVFAEKRNMRLIIPVLASEKCVNFEGLASTFCQIFSYCFADSVHESEMIFETFQDTDLVSFVRMLWHKVLSKVDATKDVLISDERFVNVLNTFNLLYISVIDNFVADDEFFFAAVPFSKQTNMNIITILKELVMKFVFMSTGKPDTVERILRSVQYQRIVDTLKQSSCKLLSLFYMLDLETRFCPLSTWMISEDLSKEINKKLVSQNHMEIANDARIIELITHAPFFIPFKYRIRLFQYFVKLDKDQYVYHNGRRRDPVVIVRPETNEKHRNEVFLSAFNRMKRYSAIQWKNMLKIQFANEEGIGKGVEREFIQLLIKQSYLSDFGYFVASPVNELYPNHHILSNKVDDGLVFEFLGKIIAKVLYEGFQVPVPFCQSFLKLLLPTKEDKTQLSIFDLKKFDSTLAKGLKFVFSSSNEELESLYLRFTDTHEAVDLIPNGSKIKVDSRNRYKYIKEFIRYKLSTRFAHPLKCFKRGFFSIINRRWIRFFNEKELYLLICGDEGMQIDIQDWKNNVIYEGGYYANHKTIRMFWDIVENDMKNTKRKRLLQFITSSPNPPLLGFSDFKPKIVIRKSATKEKRLPTASTCVHLLKLPEFKDRDEFKRMLFLAIDHPMEFHLS